MIEVRQITKRYGKTLAVDNLSFGADKGEILGFLGPNGAGKTTTMRILTCFMPPTSGSAVVAGYDCFKNPLEVKKRIGYLPESAPLYPEMKVREFLNFVATVKGLRGGRRKTQIEKVMEQTGIADVAGRLIGKISKGYRQRVGFAQAILGDPEVLLLDEPTEGLDPQQIIEIRRLIKNLAGERTVILSTHILPEVSLICDRVVIIHKGRLAAVDTPQNLTARMQKKTVIYVNVDGNPEEIRNFIESLDGVSDVRSGGYVTQHECPLEVETAPDFDVRRSLAAGIVNQGWGLLEMRQKHLSLEEVFVELVAEEEREEKTDV